MPSSTLIVNTKSRLIEFADRSNFVLGETYDPLIFSGCLGADLSTLSLFLYEPTTKTLMAGAFNDPLSGGTPEITKNLDRYSCAINFLSADCVNLFAQNQEPKDLNLIIRDANLVYAKATVQLLYAPNVVAGPAPELPTLEAAFASHNLDPDAHKPLVACSQIPDLTLSVSDDSITFSQLLTNFNALITALRTPRT